MCDPEKRRASRALAARRMPVDLSLRERDGGRRTTVSARSAIDAPCGVPTPSAGVSFPFVVADGSGHRSTRLAGSMHPAGNVRLRLTFGTACAVGVAMLAVTCGGSTTTITELSGPDAVRCQTEVSAAPSTIPAAGNRVTLTVLAARECAWTASSEA